MSESVTLAAKRIEELLCQPASVEADHEIVTLRGIYPDAWKRAIANLPGDAWMRARALVLDAESRTAPLFGDQAGRTA